MKSILSELYYKEKELKIAMDRRRALNMGELWERWRIFLGIWAAIRNINHRFFKKVFSLRVEFYEEHIITNISI